MACLMGDKMTQGTEIDKLTIFSQNPLLSDCYLITFKLTLIDCTASKNTFGYKRSENAVAKFKENVLSSFTTKSCHGFTVFKS